MNFSLKMSCKDFEEHASAEYCRLGLIILSFFFITSLLSHMNTTSIKIDTRPIVLSRGIFDLLKSHLRRRKLSKYNENKLELELRYARQVLHRELPEDIVTVNTRVRVKELVSGNEFTYNLVAAEHAKRKNNTLSILSPIGVAMLGYPQGAELQWEMPEGIKVFRIEEVLRS